MLSSRLMVAIVVLEATDAATFPQWENQSQIIINGSFVIGERGAQRPIVYVPTNVCVSFIAIQRTSSTSFGS